MNFNCGTRIRFGARLSTIFRRISAEGRGAAVSMLLAALLALSTSCARVGAWRTDAPSPCPGGPGDFCETTYIEKHANYDLAFVEFSERGNVFDRGKLDAVLDHVWEYTKPDGPSATVIVFVHGWKHNASSDDKNVRSFRGLLDSTARVLKQNDNLEREKAKKENREPQPTRGGGRVIGIYVGWRGLSIDVEYLNNITFWDRKAVAEEVGKGGVSELLLRLETRVVAEDMDDNNIFLVIGHSFGGAIVLSAMNEIFLERLADAEHLESENGAPQMVETRPFGHGVVLLNPAIEANQALQLKELSSEMRFNLSQDRLLHVISSLGDNATRIPFKAGQILGVNLSWKQVKLDRTFNDCNDSREVRLDERALDTETIGNYVPFQTGLMTARTAEGEEPTRWKYTSCVLSEDCVGAEDRDSHIPVSAAEPIQFIQTDRNFIRNHNDVFNLSVAAYLATIYAEAEYRRDPGWDIESFDPCEETLEEEEALAESEEADESEEDEDFDPCRPGEFAFNFRACFDEYIDRFKEARGRKFRE